MCINATLSMQHNVILHHVILYYTILQPITLQYYIILLPSTYHYIIVQSPPTNVEPRCAAGGRPAATGGRSTTSRARYIYIYIYIHIYIYTHVLGASSLRKISLLTFQSPH